MRNIKLILISLLGLGAFKANAQFGYYEDALRYSQTNSLIGSTARMQGFAGAQTSLGGDLSLINSNPAGLGFYNRSSAAISLSMDFQNSDDSFAGLVTPNFNNQFGIRNAGVVMNYNKGRFTEEKFKGGSLGISFAKVNDFNREYRYEGESGTSIVDFFLDEAYLTSPNGAGNFPSGSYAEAAYNQFLIDFDDTSNPNDYTEYEDNGDQIISPISDANSINGYTSPFGAGFSTPYQQHSIIETGGQHQVNISWGGNYDDRFYFGGGVGFQTLYFKRNRNLLESEFLLPDGSPDPWINSIDFRDEIVARGGGVNMSLGAIVRPIDILTVGISYQSPTFLTINEESDFSLAANWNNYIYYDSLNTQQFYNLDEIDTYLPEFIVETKYRIKTPSRLNAGATVFLGKSGFISGDLEFVDYANAELQSNDFSPLGDNQEILNYKSVVNYRMGGEYRMDNLRFRAGVGLNQDATGLGNDRTHTTFGIGYISSDFFLDLAIVNTKAKLVKSIYPIDPNSIYPQSTSQIKNTTVTISAGFNF